MKKETPAFSTSTRERLLRAAAAVFARDGLTGATTRAIADEAGVNEVTLFRLFGTKQRLLDAVVHENFGPEASGLEGRVPSPSSDLRKDLTSYARAYEQRLEENLPLIRAMIGEIHHHTENERQVFHSIFRPLRESLMERLALAQRDGEVSERCDPAILSDLFAGMLFSGVLRRSSAAAQRRRDYSTASYLEAAVDLVIRGAAP